MQRREQARRDAAWQSIVNERGERYADCTLKNFACEHAGQTEAVGALRAYAEEMPQRVKAGEGLLFFGPKGSGKDHLMSAMMRAAIRTYDLTVRWHNGQDLFGAIRDRMDAEQSEADFVRSLTHPAILAISDPLPVFGDLTAHQANMLFRVIDRRYSERKATWVTLNTKDGKEAESRMGGQIVDRLRHGTLTISCNWPSYRSKPQPP